MKNVMTIGVDLAKHVFFAVALDDQGQRDSRKKLRRAEVERFFAQQPPARIALEACASAHYWARRLMALGHEVVLLPPQHVKGYLRGQKNDYNDAEALAEALQHGRIRAVAIKSPADQDRQSLDRLRQHWVDEQTCLINQLRGLLAEYGVVVPRGKGSLLGSIEGILEDGENALSEVMRQLLARQAGQLRRVNEELAWYQSQIQQQARADEACQRLQSIPGFGPVVSFRFRNWIGEGQQFHRGRDVSAALGLVPRQHSTGGKAQLMGITKKGDASLRSVLIHGARAVVRVASGKSDRLSLWVQRLVARCGTNKATVALANKLARIAWVVVVRGERYRSYPA
jgi:transposase